MDVNNKSNYLFLKSLSDRTFLFLALFFLISFFGVGQNVFWTETFDGANCVATSGCDPSLVAWTVTNTGTNGAAANNWYVSATECGNAAGLCGSSCSNDQSLHIGNASNSSAAFIFCPSGDCGAAYDDSGAGEITDKRCESPTINCSGQANISVNFNYIEKGQGAFDDATLWYFDGSTWSSVDAIAKTGNGCNPQGIWTALTASLPASANNNPNVKIGFRWMNNGDGNATDPSFAVDDITLFTTVPVLTASITASGLTICQGESITFSDSSVGVDINSWNWSFNGGSPASASTQGPHNVVFATSGTYSVTLQVGNAGGQTDSETIQVIVQPLPTVLISANPSSALCNGDSLSLSGNGASTYVWSNGIVNGTSFTPTIGTTTYTVTGTDANGCENQDSIAITVNTNPIVNISSSDNDNIVCEGEALTLTGIGNYIFTWNQSVSNNISFVPPTGITIYTLTATDLNGCTNTGSISIEVVPCSDPPTNDLVIPDAISPNGDNLNDSWFISGLTNYPNASVKVLNRWGQVVYEGTTITQPWDGTFQGKELPIGDYYYIIDLGNGEKFNGVVTLKR